MGGVTWKGPFCPELLSYQKKYGHASPGPPFFRYDTDLKEIQFSFQKLEKKDKIKKNIKTNSTFFLLS